MKKKPRKTTRKNTLQNLVLVPIIDLNEQSVLERRRREAEKAVAAASLESERSKTVH